MPHLSSCVKRAAPAEKVLLNIGVVFIPYALLSIPYSFLKGVKINILKRFHKNSKDYFKVICCNLIPPAIFLFPPKYIRSFIIVSFTHILGF